jgi:hypothetical protein
MGGPTKAPAPGRVKSHSRRGRPLALIIRGGAGHALGGMGGAASVVWARPRPREICGGVMRMPFWAGVSGCDGAVTGWSLSLANLASARRSVCSSSLFPGTLRLFTARSYTRDE